MSKSSLDAVVTMWERGCLSAALSGIEEMQRTNGDGKLSPAATRLEEQIRQRRLAAQNASVELTEGALCHEFSQFVAEDLQQRSRTGGSADKSLIDGLLCCDAEHQRGILESTSRARTALYNESANTYDSIKSNMMRPLMLNNDRVAGWMAIRDGLRSCPFVTLWHGRIELNDCSVREPRIVALARLTFDPRSEEEDARRAREILSVLEDHSNGLDQARHLDDDLDFLQGNNGRLESEDIPTLRWWAAFLLIDAKNWTSAQDIIKSVLLDCTVNDVWPAYYLPEALFLAALTEFGLDHQEACHQYLVSYFDLAESIDRNRADATLLQVWATQCQVPRPPTLQSLCAQQLKKDASCECAELQEPFGNDTEWLVREKLPKLRESLSNSWNEHTFAAFTWLRMELSRRLEIEEENPYLPLVNHIEASWKNRSMLRRPPHVDATIRRFKETCGRTITIRHIFHEKRRDEPWS